MESPRAITKILIPSKRGNLLHRPRLVDSLHEHIERKLLLVSASAGYGKTSLLIDFAHETTLPVCWYSLDASDSDPKIFLEYLIASLHRQFPGFGTRTLGLLSSGTVLRDIDVVVGTLVTEIHENIPRYFVLVLDDFHTVEESETVNHLLDTFLRLLPGNAHLILASRTLPSKLTLTRLTARQEIAGLGVNDLRFTADEIRALARQNYHVELSDAQAAELEEHSEGWITGILLTTHTLWQGLFQDLVRLQGPHSYVFNYLTSEVFALQPPEMQRFLLDTSIFDQLDPTICDELLGTQNTAEMLSRIEQKNLFITRLEEAGAWYRYHHLFQEFLQSRLIESDAARWRNLNQRAARLFQARGIWDQVIAHYLKAQRFNDAARAIAHIAKETFDAGHWTTLARWIDALPPETLDLHPDLLVSRAMVFAETGNRSRAVEVYSRALEIYEQRNDPAGIGNTLIKQAVCWRYHGKYQEAIEDCQRALNLLSQDAKGDLAQAHHLLGTSYGLLGVWEKCIHELDWALKLYESSNDLTHVAWLHHDLGVAHRTAGSNTTAQKHFEQALDYWQRANNVVGLANTLNSIGVGYHRQGNYPQALETLEQARDAAQKCGQLYIEALALASLGDVYRDKGEYNQAQEAYQASFDIVQRINEGFLITYTLNALGEIFRLIGKFDMADQLLHQALEQAESHRSDYEVGLTQTTLGILDCDQGNISAARKHLARAVALLEQGGAKRDSARAHLHLARANLMQRKYRQVTQNLKSVADVGMHLREDQFIIADRKQLLPIIQYAVLKRIGDGYFARVLEKIKSLSTVPSTPPVEESTEAGIPRLEARAFGIATVFVNGQQITKTGWDSATTKELFFFLLANPQGLRKEQILNVLWGDIPPAKANGIFHSTAYRMRRALFPDCLVYDNGLYRLSEVNRWEDVTEFRKLISQAKRAKTEDERAAFYRDALALYQDDYFEDSYSDWCVPIRTNLQDDYLGALESLAHYHDQHADSDQAMSLYRRILDKDAYREDVYRALMRLQFKSGDRAGALKTYQRCAQILQEEMNLDASPETRALYEQIRTAGD